MVTKKTVVLLFLPKFLDYAFKDFTLITLITLTNRASIVHPSDNPGCNYDKL